ncbi:FliO/MopB family protein [Pseudarthrobacter sp. NPDC058362]|uniref:FliO/MopB family protein n=1 Tax=unclassified Pseudarthrobacter TaxID=2647000 RepID=UPI00364A2545
MDELILWLRVILSLGAVLALLWIIQRRVGRNAGTAVGNSRPLQLIARQGIGQKASVVIVEADGQRLLLGVTEQSVTVINSTDARTAEPAAVQAAPAASFRDALAAETGESTTAISRERRERRRTRGSRNGLEGSILSLKTWQDSAAALRTGADALKNGTDAVQSTGTDALTNGSRN